MIECLWPDLPGFNFFLFFYFFYPSIQLYILLSHFRCFIFCLYLDLFESEDDTLISKGSFMRTKHIFILIHIRNKGDVGTNK